MVLRLGSHVGSRSVKMAAFKEDCGRTRRVVAAVCRDSYKDESTTLAGKSTGIPPYKGIILSSVIQG